MCQSVASSTGPDPKSSRNWFTPILSSLTKTIRYYNVNIIYSSTLILSSLSDTSIRIWDYLVIYLYIHSNLKLCFADTLGQILEDKNDTVYVQSDHSDLVYWLCIHPFQSNFVSSTRLKFAKYETDCPYPVAFLPPACLFTPGLPFYPRPAFLPPTCLFTPTLLFAITFLPCSLFTTYPLFYNLNAFLLSSAFLFTTHCHRT